MARSQVRVLWWLALLALLFAAGCAPGSNELANSIREGKDSSAGFWLGLWHGFIAPITLIISLFTSSVQLYEVHNNGAWYNVGFFVGIAILGAGSHGRRRKKAKS